MADRWTDAGREPILAALRGWVGDRDWLPHAADAVLDALTADRWRPPAPPEPLARFVVGEDDECPRSQRVDGKKHSEVWYSDGPYLRCVYCDRLRDAMNGRILREGTADA